MLLVLAGVSIFGVLWATGHEDNPVRKVPTTKVMERETPPAVDVNQNLKSLAAASAETNDVNQERAKVPMAAAAPPAAIPPPPSLELPAAPSPSRPLIPIPPQNALAARAPLPLPPPGQAVLSPASLAAPRPTGVVTNPQLQEGLEVAKHLRAKGDMQGALDALRATDLRNPNQPVVLSELALTYEAMILSAKAEAYWKRILNMGEAVAGPSYQLAKSKLEQPLMVSASSEIASALSLGTCQVIKDPNVQNGERITVRLPILAKPGTVIQPEKMEIHVFLFEQVNDGQRIEQARAEAPVQNWVTAPIDWSEPDGESIDVTYNLPTPTEEELRDLGKRNFYGYMVKLFYQDKLVGEQAEPASLLEFTKQPGAPAGGLDGTLFPR